MGGTVLSGTPLPLLRMGTVEHHLLESLSTQRRLRISQEDAGRIRAAEKGSDHEAVKLVLEILFKKPAGREFGKHR
jgi:hypothetical protein